MVFAPMTLVAFATVPPALRPDGSSLLALVRNLGASLGISAIVTMLARNQQESHADIATHVTGSMIRGFNLPDAAARMPGIGPMAMSMVNGEVTRQATMIAYLDNFRLLAFLLLAIAPVPFLLRKSAPVADAPHMALE